MSISSFNISPSEAARSRSARPSIANPAILAFVVLLSACHAFNAIDRVIFPALLVPINKDYGLSLAQGGFLSTSFAIFIAVFGALSGWSMAKFGRKATMAGGVIIFSFFTMITPLASNFYDLTIYRSITGAGEGLLISGLYAALGAYFGANRGGATGIAAAMYGVGAFVGPMVGTRLAESFDSWRIPFYLNGIVGIVLAIAVIAFVPSSFANATDSEKIAGKVDSKPVSGGLFNRNSVLLTLGFGLTGWSLYTYLSLYPAYLRVELGYTVADAGAAFSMYGIGAMLAVVCGWLGDKLKRPGHLAALALMSINGYLLFHGTWSFPVHAFLSLMEGALFTGYLWQRFIAVVQRSVPSEYVNYSMSLIIPTFYVAALFSGLVFGWAVGLIGWGPASTILAALPPALAFVLTCFSDPRRVRGEAE